MAKRKNYNEIDPKILLEKARNSLSLLINDPYISNRYPQPGGDIVIEKRQHKSKIDHCASVLKEIEKFLY